MLALQVKCERTLPDVMMTYIDPDSSRVSPGRTSLLTLPGRHAIGPHGGDLEWQLVTTEEDLYQMLCVARKCQGKLDKGDVMLHDGTRQSVLLLNAGLWLHSRCPTCSYWGLLGGGCKGRESGRSGAGVSGVPDVQKTLSFLTMPIWLKMEDLQRRRFGGWLVSIQPGKIPPFAGKIQS